METRALHSVGKRFITIAVLLASVPFWLLAASHYPGGTSWDTTSLGFSFTANFVSSLFQPRALNGMLNEARPFAFIAMLLYTASVGVMFWVISVSYPKSSASKTVQIFGVGSMVYTLVAVTTPMHNFLVVIAAVFLGVACAGMVVLLRRNRQNKLALLGIVNLLLLAALSATTEGHFLVELGPACEWLLFLIGALWVTLVYLGATSPHKDPTETPKTLSAVKPLG